MKKKTICIIHYNTPQMTEAVILSVRKQCAEDYQIIVFDNSDKRPFTAKMKGVKVLNNRQQQLVNFDKELEARPNKCFEYAIQSNFGSAKHMMSVQYLWDVVPEGFILLESDVLLKKDIGFLWDENYAACGKVQWLHSRYPREVSADRLLPFLCYLNVPLLKANGAKYYDPERSWCLHSANPQDPRNRYDTGACILEDIKNTKPQLVARLYADLDRCFEHYNGGSWRKNDPAGQEEWINEHRSLWEPYPTTDAKIYICTHKDFTPKVNNPVYEILDARKWERTKADKQTGLFFSELAHMQQVANKKKLPAMVGFCHYRKYFDFMNNVPANLADMECIVSARINLGMSMRDQYATFSNVEDLDALTHIIDNYYHDFFPAWQHALNSHEMHPCSMFVIPQDKFREMVRFAVSAINSTIFSLPGVDDTGASTLDDIEKRIQENSAAYHVNEVGKDYAFRIGGQLAERLISAWIDWQYPQATQYNINITEQK